MKPIKFLGAFFLLGVLSSPNYAQNALDSQLHVLTEQIRLNNGDASAYLERATLYARGQNNELAIADAGSAIKLLAEVPLAKDDFKGSSMVLRTIQERAYSLRMRLYSATRQHSQVVADATRYIAILDARKSGWASNSTFLALKELHRGAAVNAVNARIGEAYANRGRASQRLGKFDSAISDLQQAATLETIDSVKNGYLEEVSSITAEKHNR